MIVHRNCEIRLTPEGNFSVRKRSDGHTFRPRFATWQEAVKWLDESLAAAEPIKLEAKHRALNARYGRKLR